MGVAGDRKLFAVDCLCLIKKRRSHDSFNRSTLQQKQKMHTERTNTHPEEIRGDSRFLTWNCVHVILWVRCVFCVVGACRHSQHVCVCVCVCVCVYLCVYCMICKDSTSSQWPLGKSFI
jgi:hypothetical protein